MSAGGPLYSRGLTMADDSEPLDLPTYLKALSRRKGRIVLAAIGGAVAAVVAGWLGEKVYETHFTIRIGRVWYEQNRAIGVESAPELAEIITSPAFVQELKVSLGLKGDLRALQKRIRPYFSERTDANLLGVLTVGVRGPTPEESLQLAKGITEKTLERHNKRVGEAIAVRKEWEKDFGVQVAASEKAIEGLKDLITAAHKNPKSDMQALILQADLETRESNLAKLREKYREVQTENSELLSQQTQIVSGPYKPAKPIKPDHRQNAMMGVAAGALLYLLIIFVREAARIGARKS